MKSIHTFLKYLYALTFILSTQFLNAQERKQIKIDASRKLASVNPNMWGVFFEDINFGADGGIYAELLKNRSFEFPKPLMGWQIQKQNAVEGDALIINKAEDVANKRFLRIDSKGNLSLVNEGFRGIGFLKDATYSFSIMYRNNNKPVNIKLELLDEKSTLIGTQNLSLSASENWKTANASIKSTSISQSGKFRLVFEANVKIDVDMISLFPENTWKKRDKGLRNDMVQMLADMKPGFIRFPGGCIVEGTDLANRYQWKKTIGPIEDRQLLINRWNTEFAHRSASDYFQSFGLGFYEYFLLAEDIGSEPLPIINCGMACQFNSAEVVALDQLGPYVQDALDLIEFANGDASTTWGKKRIELGHEKPFNLKMLGVGNENWGPQYLEILSIFTKAIKEKYPDVKIINSSGTDPEGARFNLLDNSLRNSKADVIDEHYYRPADWFLKNAGRYDSYPRTESKVFVGEYAVHADKAIVGAERNNWQSALASASLMTGLERNADVVTMASYAPLFAHKDAWQWAPDLIWVDNLSVYGSPDYYVQKLFATNKGTAVVSCTSDEKNLIGQDGIYASTVIDEKEKILIIKVTNTNQKFSAIDFNLSGKTFPNQTINVTTLSAQQPLTTNNFSTPTQVAPVSKSAKLNGKKLGFNLEPNSFTVFKIKYK